MPLVGLHLLICLFSKSLPCWNGSLICPTCCCLLVLASQVRPSFSVLAIQFIDPLIPFQFVDVEFGIFPLYCCICDPYLQNKDTINSSLMQLSVENSEAGIAQCPWYFLTLPPAKYSVTTFLLMCWAINTATLTSFLLSFPLTFPVVATSVFDCIYMVRLLFPSI